MSFFSSLRDSVETGVAGYASGLGLNITPNLAVSAGGTATAASPLPAATRPTNANPVASLLANHTMLFVIAGMVILAIFLFKRR